MNAYKYAQSLGITGTDAEIVAHLQASSVTVKKIDLGDLLFVLNNRDMLVRLIRPADGGEKWIGSLVRMAIYLNDNGTTEQAAAVNRFFSHITNNRNEFFDTTDPQFAAPFYTLSQMMADQPTMPSSADFAAIVDLGGGYRFAGLTAEQFAAQRIEFETAQATAELAASELAKRQDWQQRFDTAMNKYGTIEQADGITDILAIAAEMGG